MASEINKAELNAAIVAVIEAQDAAEAAMAASGAAAVRLNDAASRLADLIGNAPPGDVYLLAGRGLVRIDHNYDQGMGEEGEPLLRVKKLDVYDMRSPPLA